VKYGVKLATVVTYIELLMRRKTQWCAVLCSERVKRQAPYVQSIIWARSPKYCGRPILSVRIVA